MENNDFRNKEKTLRYIIPTGTYKVKVPESKKFGRPMPEIMNVSGRSGIRFHMGSVPGDSTGCVLLPSRSDEDKIREAILKDEKLGIDSTLRFIIIPARLRMMIAMMKIQAMALTLMAMIIEIEAMASQFQAMASDLVA
ncbi:hypothetical protein AGMMS49921_09880 [Endomicrobiia bacterium]|nr:hypothetical protein AGMMS49921_09880 [Endomicrobiia bacterium]